MKFTALVLITVCLLAAGCRPRGESKSLDQVLEAARTRYHSAGLDNVPGEFRSSLEKLAGQLQEMEGSGNLEDLKDYSARVLEQLEPLEAAAGLTAQAAFSEIEKQYRELSAAEGELNRASLRLLLARTYNLLASELESTRFGR